MYKFTNHINNAKLVLVRRQFGDGSSAALIVMRAPHRRYASDGSPPKQKSSKLLWGAFGASVLTGAAVVYAKSSPDARNWLETNVPLFNDFVALVYQENTTYAGAVTKTFNSATTWLSGFMFGKEGVTPLKMPAKSEQDLAKDAKLAFYNKDYELPKPSIEPLYVEEKGTEKAGTAIEAILVQTDKCEPPPPLVVKISKDMVELEHEMHENTKIAMDKFKQATKSATEYNTALAKIVESSLDELDTKHFKTLRGAQAKRQDIGDEAIKAAAQARKAIDSIDRMIKAGVQAPPENIAITQRYIKQFRADLNQAESEYKHQVDMSALSEKYWNKVEEARGMFKDELTMMYPGIDLCARKLELKGDTDLLLVYALRRIQSLQNQIAELQTVQELKINRAIECHDEKAIIDAKVEHMVKAGAIEKEKAYLKKWLEVQTEANRNIKDQLRKQYEIQQDIMQDRLAKKEKEMMNSFTRHVSEQVEKERLQFKKELAAMAGKLQAIEHTLKQRAAAEAEARRSQALWAAGEALLAATRRPACEAKLDNELKALEKAGKGDLLVNTVLRGITSDIRDKGIATEKSLRERFDKMEKTAMKVALVGREGATLPVYFLSWLQSKLIFQKFAEIPTDELNNKPMDFTKLDTFDIMHRARYHMEHGDLPAALRYVNLLQGAARAAARPWADAARRHLEVRQAAEAVMAHASVAGLLYL